MKWRHVWITTKIALSEMLDQPRIWVACAIPAIMACQWQAPGTLSIEIQDILYRLLSRLSHG